MRRCELAGARRDLLDLDAGTLQIEPTRVVVDGAVIESDGKTENAQHLLALDPFTIAVLKAHVELLDQERRGFGPDYDDYGVLFCWENGKPPHPDTFTRRFKKLSRAAGLPAIDLLSRPGARFRCCHRPVSPDRSPNPPCRSPGNGLSAAAAIGRGSQVAMGMGSCSPGRRSGRPSRPRSGSTPPHSPRSATARLR